jgi:hypothetical protein
MVTGAGKKEKRFIETAFLCTIRFLYYICSPKTEWDLTSTPSGWFKTQILGA